MKVHWVKRERQDLEPPELIAVIPLSVETGGPNHSACAVRGWSDESDQMLSERCATTLTQVISSVFTKH